MQPSKVEVKLNKVSDLISELNQVHFILNELVMGGMVLETNMTEIMTRIEEQNKIEKEEVLPKENI